MKYPIFIPSKGGSHSTADLLDKSDIDYTVVIEPKEFDLYKNRFKGLQLYILPENDKGICYVRNFIKLLAKRWGYAYHWQIDDNIKYFYHNKKKSRHLKSQFNNIEMATNPYTNIGGASFAHSALVQDESLQLNQGLEAVMLLKSDMIVEHTKHKNYSTAMLEKGFCTMLFNNHSFLKQSNPNTRLHVTTLFNQKPILK